MKILHYAESIKSYEKYSNDPTSNAMFANNINIFLTYNYIKGEFNFD